MTEKELVKNVIPLFNTKYKIFEEVKIFTRSIDIVLKEKDELISIEFKLNDYKKAFQQISDYQLVTDYSYLCIPQKKLSMKIINKLKEKGIGLFMYCHEKNILIEEIKPNKNYMLINFYKKYLVNKLNQKDKNA